MPAKFNHSTVQCLAAVAQHHQLPVNPERLVEDDALAAEEPPAATMLRNAGDIVKNMPENARLQPGMTISAEIVVGKRSLMSYLAWPSAKRLNEAIRQP